MSPYWIFDSLPKLYIPSTLNTDYILWHTQLIVYAVGNGDSKLVGLVAKKNEKTEAWIKVIYPKYSKHWLSTVAHTIDCVCSKILNHGLNHGLLFSLFKFFGWKNILN